MKHYNYIVHMYSNNWDMYVIYMFSELGKGATSEAGSVSSELLIFG